MIRFIVRRSKDAGRCKEEGNVVVKTIRLAASHIKRFLKKTNEKQAACRLTLSAGSFAYQKVSCPFVAMPAGSFAYQQVYCHWLQCWLAASYTEGLASFSLSP